MKGMKLKTIKRMSAAALALCMAFAQTGCGGGDAPRTEMKEWVYVPEFVEVEDEDASYSNMQYVGGRLRYAFYSWDENTQTSENGFAAYSLEDKSVERVTLDWGGLVQDDGENTVTPDINDPIFASDGSIYAVGRIYSFVEQDQSYQSKQGIAKFDSQGKLALYIDMEEYLKAGGDSSWLNTVAVDGQGRIYASGNSTVWLFDADGTYRGSVAAGAAGNSYLQAMGCGSDGKMYVSVYSYDESGSRNSLSEVDFEAKKLGASYENFPDGSNDRLVAGAEREFIVRDSTSVYSYSLETQTKTKLFDWLDSDINGESVRSLAVAEDGRIVAVINDWNTNDQSVAFLTKTPGSQVEQKEIILVGTLGGASALQASAVKFNKTNDRYHISIRQYLDYDSNSENAVNDAITNLNNDLTSKSNCPDIIDLSGLDVKNLVSKNVLEDLNKYLEKGGTLKREDLVESVLNAYTYDGVLTAIPSSFTLETLVGHPRDVGEEMGWTIEELMELTEKHPGAELLDRSTRSSIMYILMAYNGDTFVDWSKGKCNFDSEEFKSLLTFVNSFPESYDSEARRGVSTPTRIQRGEVLLNRVHLYDFEEIQMQYEIFGGKITCIGYPTLDGSSGTSLSAYDLYGICSKSRNKDAAWQFIESYLTQEDNDYSWGFPIEKAELEKQAKEAVEVRYWTDENGNPFLDENGEPMEIGVGSSVGYEDGWSYNYRRATQEEVDLVLSLIDRAKPATGSNSMILTIIAEEAEPFYKGQKTVDEVAKVIQSRVQIYVSENM